MNDFRAVIFLKIYYLIFKYLSYLPLTFLFGYIFFLIVVLVTDTKYESIFISIVTFTSMTKDGLYSLDTEGIVGVVFRWWLVIGIILQLFSKIFRIEIKNKNWFIMISAFLLIPTILVTVKILSSDSDWVIGVLVMTVFYVVAIGALAIYLTISSGLSNLFRYIELNR